MMIRALRAFRPAILCCLLLLLGTFVPSLGQDAAFTASVDRNTMSSSEQFQLTFALNGSSAGKNFRPPPLNDFLVLSGPNQSTSMQFINGSMSASVSYSYILQPRAEGKFTVGPASIDYDGKTLKSQPLTLTVSKGAASPKQGQGGSAAASDADVGKQIGDNLYLRAAVDKSRIYQGEQITVTYKIYTRVSVVNYQITKVPALTGFWSEDVDVPKQIQLTTETINGKQYRVGILKKVALFPQRSGTLDLDPMEVECVVQMQAKRRANDLFDQFFNDPFFGNVRNVNYKVRSEPVKVTIQPLPAASVPAGFHGAVGSFSMDVWLDKTKTSTNEPVTLKVKITGKGNIKLLEAPEVTVPPDIERYDPKVTDNIAKGGERIGGSRTFEYLLIPRHAGEQEIPAIHFAYFDLDKKAYMALTGPAFTISVAKGNENVSSTMTGVGREDVKMLGEDIRFIKSDDFAFRRKGGAFVSSPVFYLLALSPIAAFLGFVVFLRRREKALGDVAGLKNRKARKVAQKRLTEAKKFLDGGKKEEFYAETSRALFGYIADKLSISPADLSLDTIRRSLAGRGVAEDVVERVAKTLEQCEFARFAPAVGSVQMDGMYREAADLISSIEDTIR
jgi:hypothetical protein